MITATKAQIIGIRTMLSKLGLKEEKENLISTYTKERTTHITKMSKSEAAQLIKNLKNPNEEAQERQRKHIIAMAHNMNWQLPGGKADMQRVNGWVQQYGHLSGKLNDYEGEALQKLVTQFQKVYKHYLKAIEK